MTAALRAAASVIALSVVMVACSSSPSALKISEPGTRLSTTAHDTCARSALDVPSCGVLWGAYLAQPNYAGLEQEIGRRLDIIKSYVGWQAREPTFPNPTERALAADGRILDFSWSPVNFQTRAAVSYASIASGQWDNSVIRPEARALKTFHHRVFIDFGHEFDAVSHADRGTPAQYVAAYRHIHDVMAQAGVTNVIWTWVSTGYPSHEAQIAAAYPGPSYVDWIGYDPYNFAECHGAPSHDPYDTFAPFYDWLQTQPTMSGKPIMLAEYGTAPGPGAEAWYAGVTGALAQLPKIKAAIQFDYGTGAGCDVRLSATDGSLTGFAASGDSPYILGR